MTQSTNSGWPFRFAACTGFNCNFISIAVHINGRVIHPKPHIHTQINESITPDQTRAPFVSYALCILPSSSHDYIHVLHEKSDIPPTNASSVPHGTPLYTNEATKSGSKHEVKLLYRQIDNIKDEMEGISKH
eukprot:657493_1